MRHKNVKNEKKQKDFHKKRKNHLLYPQKTIIQTRQRICSCLRTRWHIKRGG